MSPDLRNQFKSPGSEHLDKMLSPYKHGSQPKPKVEEKPLAKNKGGGAGRAKPKPVSPDQEWEDEEASSQRDKANTPEPVTPPDRTVVKITNLKWESKTISVSGTAFHTMDVSIPASLGHLTKITCSLEQETGVNVWKAIPATFKPCDAKDGKARCELAVPEPLKKADGKEYDKIHYRIVAKHSYSEEANGPPIQATPGDASRFDSVIFYSPVRKEYLCFDTEAEYKSLFPELDLMERLQTLSNKALESKDEKERKEAQKKLDDETANLFDKELVGDASGAVEELLLIRRNKKWGERGKGWVYIRPYAKKKKTEIKGHWRKDSDATLKKNLDDLMKRAPGSKEHSPLFESEFKAKLFQTDPLKAQAILWGDKAKGGKEGEGFSFSGEAAVCRFAANFTAAEGSINLKEKKIHIGGGGSVSFAVLEGKAEGKYPWPVAGVNLLEHLEKSEYLEGFIKRGRKCLLRLNVSFGAQGFGGLSVAGAVNLLDMDLEKEKPTSKKKGGAHASTGVSAEAFAGAQVNGELTVSPEWSRGDATSKFEALGSCGVEGGASAGIGGKAECTISYQNGTFHIKAGAGLTAGLGFKGGFSFELSVEEGYHFIGYLLNCVDFHFVTEIQKEAFEVYKNYSFTLLTLGRKAFTAEKVVVENIITGFTSWFSNLGDDAKKIKDAVLDATSATSTLSNVPPEALGQALRTIMTTQEKDDFRAIMGILNSTLRRNANPDSDPSATHKLKWTLRAVSGLLNPEEDKKANEAKKGEAIRLGIKKIGDFGKGIGVKGPDGSPAKKDFDFLDRFHEFLERNRIK